MIDKKEIERLCKEQTDLEQADIDCLVQQAEELLASSDYVDDDVFIDVKNIYSGHATVIFHKKPATRGSLYTNRVVGSPAYLEREPGVHRTLHVGIPTKGLSGLSQEGVTIQQTVFPIVREERVIGTLIIEKDIVETLVSYLSINEGQTEQQQSSSYFAVMDYIEDSVLAFDAKGQLVYCNAAAKEMYRYKFSYMDDIKGMHYDNLAFISVNFDKINRKSQGLSKAYSNQSEFAYGSYFFSIKQYVVDAQILVMVLRDITEMKKMEDLIALQKNSLREANHRVKNNLQTVESLLRLQVQNEEDLEHKESLANSVNRVHSIAITHELLTTQLDDKIDLESLLSGVAENLRNCFANKPNISLFLDIEKSIYLESKKATALSLVVNELLQNSYEHAFEKSKQKKSKIYLQIKRNDDIIIANVSDNGSGYKKDSSTKNHLGLMIVEGFVKSQLSGRLSVTSDGKGTRTTIKFKE